VKKEKRGRRGVQIKMGRREKQKGMLRAELELNHKSP
jgi:hypothetical protein